MDDVLRLAMEPVLRDLRNTDAPRPRVSEADWPGTGRAMLWSEDGGGSGIAVDRDAGEAERIAMVADQVQEWAIEELQRVGRTNWPPCPHHPDSHPRFPEARDQVAVWACPIDGTAVAEIGTL